MVNNASDKLGEREKIGNFNFDQKKKKCETRLIIQLKANNNGNLATEKSRKFTERRRLPPKMMIN